MESWILSTYGLSEDISEDEVYTPFEQEFGCEIVTETGGTNEPLYQAGSRQRVFY